jgi:nucleoside-diphosphate-sugar epimerase
LPESKKKEMKPGKMLVIGSLGQIGVELVLRLRELFGEDNVVASDVKSPEGTLIEDGLFETLDVMNPKDLGRVVKKHNIDTVYHLAALLSATAERNPKFGWQLNMDGLFHVLDLARDGDLKKIFWPSSIAVFGPTTPRANTPQHTVIEPTSVYGISKFAGERWCQYYFDKYGVDVRSLRYPGLIGHRTMPGGGTTDYAVDIYYKAIQDGFYECFLGHETRLPMMYMDDAIRATIEITEAPADLIKVRSGYNLSGMDFTPAEIAAEITKHLPEFRISYQPDYRQAIADSWPDSIDDKEARADWGWKHEFDLQRMTEIMLQEIRKKQGIETLGT